MLKCAATTMYFVCIHMRSFCQLLVHQQNPCRPVRSAHMLQSLLMLLVMSNQVPHFCATHKNATMVNLVSPRCTAEGCNLQASFALLPSKAALYCGQHSVGKGAVVCVGGGPPCIGDVCSKEATYGYKGEPAIYCKTCIPEDVKDK
eukprot:1391-Heterococcus_DN1.PRE.1